MRKMILVVAATLALAAWVSPAQAVSPCCEVERGGVAAIKDHACNDLDGSAPAGCLEVSDGTCIGGGLAVGAPSTTQSPLGGCVCVEGNCVSDGPVGHLLTGTPDPREGDPLSACTRDSVSACVNAGAAHEVAAP